MMENIFQLHPQESVVFFKRIMMFAMMCGLLVVSPTVWGVYASWDSLNVIDIYLRWWAVARIAVFVAQLPVRWRLYCYITEAEMMANNDQMSEKLIRMLNTREWKFSQCISMFICIWLVSTICGTWYCGSEWVEKNGFLSPSMNRICWVSVLLLFLQIWVSFYWLTGLLDHGWLDNGISEADLHANTKLFKWECIKRKDGKLTPHQTGEEAPTEVDRKEQGADALQPQGQNQNGNAWEDDPAGVGRLFGIIRNQGENAVGFFRQQAHNLFAMGPRDPNVPRNFQPASTAAQGSERPVGLSLAEIEHIRERNENECTICKQDYESEDMARMLPCRHWFHEDCLKTWLSVGSGHSRCPVCTHNITAPHQTYNKKND